MTKDEALNYLKNELGYNELVVLLDHKVHLKDTKVSSHLGLELLALLTLSEISQELNRRRQLKEQEG